MTKHFLTKTVSDTIHYSFGTEIFCVVWRLKEKLECGFAQLYLLVLIIKSGAWHGLGAGLTSAAEGTKGVQHVRRFAL